MSHLDTSWCPRTHDFGTYHQTQSHGRTPYFNHPSISRERENLTHPRVPQGACLTTCSSKSHVQSRAHESQNVHRQRIVITIRVMGELPASITLQSARKLEILTHPLVCPTKHDASTPHTESRSHEGNRAGPRDNCTSPASANHVRSP